MSPGHGLSAIAIGGGNAVATMLSLLRGRRCTNNSVNSSGAIMGTIGPSIISTGSGGNAILDAGNAAVVDTGQTLAAIFLYNSAHTDNPVFIGSGSVFGAAWYFGVDGTTKQLVTYTGGGGPNSGLVLNNNETYFAAVSNDGNNLYFIAKSLTTGSVRTATLTGTSASNATSFTSSGTYTIQSDTFLNQVKFPLAAVSYTPAFLPLSQLLAWSADPWAFWYPNKTSNRVAVAAAGFLAAWAGGSNLPVIGTGTY